MKRRAVTLVEILIILFVIGILLVVFFPMAGLRLSANPSADPRRICASNLKQIYTGLILYSQDYAGAFPMIDLKSGKITGIEKVERNVKPDDVDDPFTDIPDEANRSISQNLWLLVRSEFVLPKIFNCPSSEQTERKFPMKEEDGRNRGAGPTYFVNFPYEKSGTTISYSFVHPWTKFDGKKGKGSWDQWSADADPRVAIGADANNGKEPNHPFDATSKSWFSGNGDLKEYINSTNHKGEGQNVLYGDGHVQFEKSAYTGINHDNIYTAQPPEYVGEAGKTPGVLSVRPKDENDSVLIPNREDDLKAWDRKP